MSEKYKERRSPLTRKNCLTLFNSDEIKEFIVFDTETTGKDDDARIVEFAGIKYVRVNNNFVEKEIVNIYIRPPFEMKEKVISIHHITNEYLKDMPYEEDAFADIVSFFGDRPIIIGHNVMFDIERVSSLYSRQGLSFRYAFALDTLEMARDIVSRKVTTDYSLGSLAVCYGIDLGVDFHNALADAKTTSRLLKLFYDAYREMPDIGPATDITVNYMWFWKGHRREQTGIYLETSIGRVYYSTFLKCWKIASDINVNIVKLEKDVLRMTGLSSMRDFGKLTENKLKEIKESRKKQGVYI